MNKLSLLILCLACMYGCAFTSSTHAQDNTQYYARLSVMPVDKASFSMLSDGGEADAELSGSKLAAYDVRTMKEVWSVEQRAAFLTVF